MKVRRAASVCVMCALGVLLVVAIGAVATAATVSPIAHSGNTPGGEDLRITDPTSGSYAIPGQPGKYVAITVSAYGEGQQLAFSSDLAVLKVYMKGGPNGYNEYSYGAGGTYADSGLVCPPNNRGNTPIIGHVCFYFGQGEGTTTTAAETTTTEAPTTTTSSTIVGDTGDTTTTSSTEVDDTGDTTTTSTEEMEEEETTSTSEDSEGTAESGGGQTTVNAIQTGGSDSGGPGAGTWALAMLALALAGGLGWTTLRPVLKRR